MTEKPKKGAPNVTELKPAQQKPAEKKPTQISCSRGLHSFMERNRLSFGFTS